MTPDASESDERLILGDLLNHVLDKGVVIAGDVTISVADIDLIRLGLSLFITAVETVEQQSRGGDKALTADGDVPLLPSD
jgi:gas vesicle structural protein